MSVLFAHVCFGCICLFCLCMTYLFLYLVLHVCFYLYIFVVVPLFSFSSDVFVSTLKKTFLFLSHHVNFFFTCLFSSAHICLIVHCIVNLSVFVHMCLSLSVHVYFICTCLFVFVQMSVLFEHVCFISTCLFCLLWC